MDELIHSELTVEASPQTQPDCGPLEAARLPGIEELRLAITELQLQLENRSAELSHANQQLQEQIRERRQIESAFHESEERFMAFMNNTPAMAFIKDENGRYVYGNERWKSFFGGRAGAGARHRADVAQ